MNETELRVRLLEICAHPGRDTEAIVNQAEKFEAYVRGISKKDDKSREKNKSASSAEDFLS